MTDEWTRPGSARLNAASFNAEALRLVHERVASLRTLTYTDALRLPEARGEDVVVAGKEVQLTTFRQAGGESLKGRVLVTVQLARFGLGGIASYKTESGRVFSADAPPREATADELLMTGGQG